MQGLWSDQVLLATLDCSDRWNGWNASCGKWSRLHARCGRGWHAFGVRRCQVAETLLDDFGRYDVRTALGLCGQWKRICDEFIARRRERCRLLLLDERRDLRI